ncbi:MAG: hypothetical protein KGI79_02945, partial [Patescibacteria group bacterium]|nr:hypothetical protein [Patescibacteria group bacterium]
MHEDPVSTGPQNPGARLAKEAAARGIRAAWKRVWHSLYETLIEPRSADEDSRRKELIFNIIALFLLAVLVFLELSVIYADIAGAAKVGFHAGTFMFFVFIFGSLLAMSRKGNTELASYIFIGLYFLATTYGAYAWSTAMPVALLSYGAIIVITSVLIGTRAGLAMTAIIAATLTSLGFLETNHVVESDLSWRLGPLEIKDTIEDALIYVVIVVASWLSNREIERSLKRARTSEKALKSERDLLEIKVEERTKELKAAELEKVSQLYRFVEFGRLASGIFYDLLNPLSVVSLSVEKLTADEP